jgi:uroporphyrin-III C-methyltransferase
LLTGLPGETAVAVVQNVSLQQQRHVICTLAELQHTMAHEQLGSPSVIVVGDVLQGLSMAQLAAADMATASQSG